MFVNLAFICNYILHGSDFHCFPAYSDARLENVQYNYAQYNESISNITQTTYFLRVGSEQTPVVLVR